MLLLAYLLLQLLVMRSESRLWYYPKCVEIITIIVILKCSSKRLALLCCRRPIIIIKATLCIYVRCPLLLWLLVLYRSFDVRKIIRHYLPKWLFLQWDCIKFSRICCFLVKCRVARAWTRNHIRCFI